MKTVTNIADLRALHRRRVPRAFFDYADSGSYEEETLHANRADLERLKLRQRVLVDVSKRSMATTIVGQKAPSRPEPPWPHHLHRREKPPSYNPEARPSDLPRR